MAITMVFFQPPGIAPLLILCPVTAQGTVSRLRRAVLEFPQEYRQGLLICFAIPASKFLITLMLMVTGSLNYLSNGEMFCSHDLFILEKHTNDLCVCVSVCVRVCVCGQ